MAWTWFWLWTLLIGLTLVIGHKKAGSHYVRSRRVEATEEQMQHIYLAMGVGICVIALLGLVATLLQR